MDDERRERVERPEGGAVAAPQVPRGDTRGPMDRHDVLVVRRRGPSPLGRGEVPGAGNGARYRTDACSVGVGEDGLGCQTTSYAGTVESKPFSRSLPRLRKVESLPEGEVAHDARDEDAPRIGSRAEPGCQLDGGTEQVVAIGDRLPRSHPDTDADRRPPLVVASGEPLLDVDGTPDRIHDRGEGGHDPVTRVLDLRASVPRSARRTMSSWTRSISMARASPSCWVRLVESTMSVKRTVRNAVSTYGSPGGCSTMPPMKRSTIGSSTSMIWYGTNPCEARCTASSASASGASARQNAVWRSSSNQ